MSRIFLDTNILLRLANGGLPEHQLVKTALTKLLNSSEKGCLSAQGLIEFWVVATRPTNVNGFGWNTNDTKTAIEALRLRFTMLEESPAIYPQWLQLVSSGVSGKRAHDARLVAVMMVYGVDRIMTLNVNDFSSFPGITAVHPSAY